MTRLQRVYLLLAIAFTATLAMGISATAGVMVAVIVSGSMVVGLVGWARTSLKRPTNPARIVPVYFLTVFMLYVHICEEYLYDFGPRIGALTGTGWTEAQHMLQFGFIVPAFWILAALALYKRHPLGGLHGVVHLRGHVRRRAYTPACVPPCWRVAATTTSRAPGRRCCR